jgi:quinol monooxygenase YgiN
METNPSEIHVIARLTAQAGKTDQLRTVMRELAGHARTEPGCRQYRLYESKKERTFFADEIYLNQEAFDAHINTPHLQKAKALFPELLDGELEVHIVHETAI